MGKGCPRHGGPSPKGQGSLDFSGAVQVSYGDSKFCVLFHLFDFENFHASNIYENGDIRHTVRDTVLTYKYCTLCTVHRNVRVSLEQEIFCASSLFLNYENDDHGDITTFDLLLSNCVAGE